MGEAGGLGGVRAVVSGEDAVGGVPEGGGPAEGGGGAAAGLAEEKLEGLHSVVGHVQPEGPACQPTALVDLGSTGVLAGNWGWAWPGWPRQSCTLRRPEP